MYIFLSLVDIIIFITLGVPSLYLLFFSIASHRSKKRKELTCSVSAKKARIAVLFPAYKEEKVLFQSLETFLKQDYPSEKYAIYVIADHFEEDALLHISQLPVHVLGVAFENSSKAKSLRYAMNAIKSEGESFDIVTILDVDNLVEANYLSSINKAFQNGSRAIQTHRTAKNMETKMALLDAVSEEINNTIFRKGHVNAGLSAALIGSGIAFEAEWFAKNVEHLSTVGEDKELELLLIQQNIFVDYLEDVYVFDQKISSTDAFHKQRNRWQSAQFLIFVKMLRTLPSWYKSANIEKWNKLYQWILMPRVVHIAILFLITIFYLIVAPALVGKWIVLCILLLTALLLAVPRRLYTLRLLKTLTLLPYIAFLMFLNIFKFKQGIKKFIHTDH